MYHVLFVIFIIYYKNHFYKKNVITIVLKINNKPNRIAIGINKFGRYPGPIAFTFKGINEILFL